MVLLLPSTIQEVKHGLAWRKWWPTRCCYGRISFTKANVHHVPMLNWPCICCYGAQRTEWECNLLYRNRPQIRAEKSKGKWAYAPCLRKRPPPTWQCLLSHCCQNLPFFALFEVEQASTHWPSTLKPWPDPLWLLAIPKIGRKTCWG